MIHLFSIDRFPEQWDLNLPLLVFVALALIFVLFVL